MIAEIGQLALLAALSLAFLQGVMPLAGVAWRRSLWAAAAIPLARAQCLFLLLAFVLLAALFVGNDFSVAYVAQNSNTALPVPYRVAAVWGAHEGSLLLWCLMLSAWTAAVTVLSRRLPLFLLARVVVVRGLVSTGFLFFMVATSNPFARLLPAAIEGRDLNPLLQDPGLIIHPPMLYMGYVGFSVAFAFAIAALLSGRMDSAWARWARPWTLAAWVFLTVGIMLGSWWAYYELGWGGWWFWDPVENASFMPWLAGIALLHSLAATEARGVFKPWTALLAIMTFSLCLLGAFLVRSGVLVSVHSFATDPARGLFILLLLAVTVGGSLSLYAWRAPLLASRARFAAVSRETGILLNNIFFTVAALSVLLGTLYPL
ncbi:MAG: heme lyase CcmF/NrfE family subunit, partial [Gammaproteobacteria bacterium]